MTYLVTALGTLASGAVLRQLRKNPGSRIIGTDIYPASYIPDAREVDEFCRVPPISDPETYRDFLLQKCQESTVDFIFPVIDEEVELLSGIRAELHAIGTVPCIASDRSIRLCRNKQETMDFLRAGFPNEIMNTQALSAFMGDIKFPLFIKPRSGRASIGCLRVDTQAELDRVRQSSANSELIVQPCHEGTFYAVDVVRSETTGEIIALAREELLRNKNGAGLVVRIERNPELEVIASSMIEAIGYNGVANLEFIRDSSGYHLVEINPRLPAGTEFSCLAGLDLVGNELRAVRGEPLLQGEIRYGTTLARRYETHVTEQ